MKKLLLTLGAIASVTAPVTAVVACGADKPATPTNPANAANELVLLKVKDKATIDKSKLSDDEKLSSKKQVDGAVSVSGLNALMDMIKIKINFADGVAPKAPSSNPTGSVAKKHVADVNVQMAFEIKGTDGEGILTIHKDLPTGIASIKASKISKIASGDVIKFTVTYNDGYEGSSEVTYTVISDDLDTPAALKIKAVLTKTEKTLSDIQAVFEEVYNGFGFKIIQKNSDDEVTLETIAKALGLTNTDSIGYEDGVEGSKVGQSTFSIITDNDPTIDISDPTKVKIVLYLILSGSEHEFTILLQPKV